MYNLENFDLDDLSLQCKKPLSFFKIRATLEFSIPKIRKI